MFDSILPIHSKIKPIVHGSFKIHNSIFNSISILFFQFVKPAHLVKPAHHREFFLCKLKIIPITIDRRLHSKGESPQGDMGNGINREGKIIVEIWTHG